MKATQKLHDIGQSLWLDNITRDLLDSGTLKRYIDELSVTGLTSNPTIFDQAIEKSTPTTTASANGWRQGESGEELFFELALEDLTARGRPVPPDPRPHRRASTAGCRSRCRRCSPTTRRARSPRRRTSARARGAAEPLHQDSRHEGGRSRHRGVHLRGRADQRDAALLARAVPGRGRGLPARHRAAHRRGARSRSSPRSPRSSSAAGTWRSRARCPRR